MRRFHESNARIRIPTAPARTSKSFSAAFDIVPFCLPTDPPCDSLHWIIGPNFNVNKEFEYIRNIFVNNRHHFTTPGGSVYQIERDVCNPRAGDLELRFITHRNPKNGRQYRTIIKGMSAENERALQGEEVTTAIQSEAAEHPSHVMPKYLATRAKWLVCPTTPKAKAAWLHELCMQGDADPTLGIETFNFPPDANPHYDRDRFAMEERAAALRAKAAVGPHATAEDDPYFAEQFLGRWVYYTGRVLPMSDARNLLDASVIDPLIATGRVAVSVDYGYDDPAVAHFWLILDSGIVVLFDEIYERHLATEHFVEKIHSKLSGYGVTASYVCGDPSRPEVDRVMRDSGLKMFVMDKNAQRDRAAGSRRLIDLLVSGPLDGFPGLYVTNRCPRTIKEWKELHYREGHTNEYSPGAIRGADHAFDSARYFVMTRPRARQDPLPDNDIGRFIRERQHEAARMKRKGYFRYAS